MGLFDRFKSKQKTKTPSREEIEREMYEKNLWGYKDKKDAIDYQNVLLARVNRAQAQYKADGDLNAVIRELEFAFIQSDPPCKTSQNMSLVDYYLKAGLRDKAWGYLNMRVSKNQAPLEKIRFAQARILKSEKKYSYAIEMYACGHLAKSAFNNTFQKDMFLRDIQSCANKLKWDDDKREYVAYLIQKSVDKRAYIEQPLITSYRKFLTEIGEN